jgi:hypothetical protein
MASRSTGLIRPFSFPELTTSLRLINSQEGPIRHQRVAFPVSKERKSRISPLNVKDEEALTLSPSGIDLAGQSTVEKVRLQPVLVYNFT